jgi:membrane fusion protein (multidrug efflux system)
MNTTLNANRIGLVAAILACISLTSGCGTGEASVADSATANVLLAVPVEVTQPRRQDIFATYSAAASITSDTDAPVTVRVAGEIVELLAEEGDRVEIGQVLARLDGERLRLEMLVAAANLQRARKDLARNVDLHDRGLISTSLFEGLQYELAALKASYDLKKLNYGYSNIRATLSGVVSSRDVKLGESLQTGQVAFRITEISELVAYLQIPQAELGKFAAGHSAFVSVAALPRSQFKATIVRISPTIDARNGTFRATAIIDNASGVLAPGMFGKFTIAYQKHENALVIPSLAALDEDDKKSVFVVNDGEAMRRVISTGIEQDGQLEVLQGLASDDKIVVIGHANLRDGSKVLASVKDQKNFAG